MVAISELTGIELADDQHGNLPHWERLLDECPSVTVVETEDFEGGPGASDTFYELQVDDLAGFTAELEGCVFENLSGGEYHQRISALPPPARPARLAFPPYAP